MSSSALTPLAIDAQAVWEAGYEALALITRGQYCDVWKVRQRASARILLWKQLRPECASIPAATASLQRELQIGTDVRSPWVARLWPTLWQATPRYLIREYIRGTTLAAVCRTESRMPLLTAVWIARQLAQAVEHLHQCGYTHGAIRGTHVIVMADATVRLIDLSTAQPIVLPTSQQPTLNQGTRVSSAIAGNVVAELAHLSARSAAQPAIKAELLSLGKLLYELFTGQAPVAYESPFPTPDELQRHHARALKLRYPGMSGSLMDLLSTLVVESALPEQWSAGTITRRLVACELEELCERLPHAG